jgi:ankyrin repeat protein
MIKYMKYFIYLFVFIAFFSARAGSYEDYFVAIKQDDSRTVESLLKRGFDPNARDPKGFHGLFVAVSEPSPKVAAVLIDWSKTDVEPRTKEDESPLMIVALKGDLELRRTVTCPLPPYQSKVEVRVQG